MERVLVSKFVMFWRRGERGFPFKKKTKKQENSKEKEVAEKAKRKRVSGSGRNESCVPHNKANLQEEQITHLATTLLLK